MVNQSSFAHFLPFKILTDGSQTGGGGGGGDDGGGGGGVGGGITLFSSQLEFPFVINESRIKQKKGFKAGQRPRTCGSGS